MGGLKVLIGAYRKWAIEAGEYIKQDTITVDTPEKLLSNYIHHDPDIVILIGWSWIVPKEIYKNTTTLCFHPSDLPAYKGGSPLQHQILDGLKETKATLFIVDDSIDGGGIVNKCDLSLEGSIKEIFARMKIKAGVMVRNAVNDFPNIKATKQGEYNLIKKRRVPAESEIYATDFYHLKAEKIYNKIRALGDPYPNAFVVCGDGKKLYFKEVSIGT